MSKWCKVCWSRLVKTWHFDEWSKYYTEWLSQLLSLVFSFEFWDIVHRWACLLNRMVVAFSLRARIRGECSTMYSPPAPQWGAADAEIKVPSGENTELKRSPFKAWSRSVYSHTCYAYCQEVLPCLFLPFQSIHLHFFQNLSQFFPVLACRIK